jgi:sulfite reductase (NADPH) hemoprotein beta-component
MNACGHHHVGHIGILGVDKKGVEFYQFTLGGSADSSAAIGDRLGPAIAKDEVANTISKLLDIYVSERHSEDESFLHTYRRIGIDPFKASVYPQASSTA